MQVTLPNGVTPLPGPIVEWGDMSYTSEVCLVRVILTLTDIILVWQCVSSSDSSELGVVHKAGSGAALLASECGVLVQMFSVFSRMCFVL